MPSLETVLDYAESRILTDRMVILENGPTWAVRDSTNIYLDGLSLTALLHPSPLTPAWQTTVMGRLRKASTDKAGSVNWTEYQHPRFEGDWYMYSLGVNEKVYLTPQYPANQPMYLSWFAYNSGNDRFVNMECGWGEGTLADVRLRFWSDGTAEIWRNGSLIEDNVPYVGEEWRSRRDKPTVGKQLASDTIDITLVPCRRNALLLVSNHGGGFLHEFEDIEVNDPAPTITGAGRFWFYVPEGQAKVQFGPVTFPTTATLLGPKQKLRYKPPTGTVFTYTTYLDQPVFGPLFTVSANLVDWDGTTMFVPNGAKDQVRLRLEISGGNGTGTPSIYGVSAVVPATMANTAGGAGFDIDLYLMEPTIMVPENPSGVEMGFTLKNPAALGALGLANIRTIGNRAFRTEIGGIVQFKGRTMPPRYEDGWGDDVRRLGATARDLWYVLENYRIQEPTPLDGLLLHIAIGELVKMAGFTDADLDLEYVDYPLPTMRSGSEGKWALIPEVSDTPGQWLTRIWEEFARTYFMGWVPTATGYKFRLRSPAALGITPVLTLYADYQTAYAALIALGYTPSQAHRRIPYATYRDFHEESLEPEANVIYVTGRNPVNGKPIQSRYIDENSADPRIAVNLRPPNWIGEPRRYGWVDPALATQGDTDFVLGILAGRLTTNRLVGTWESEYLQRTNNVPLWRSDSLRLDQEGVYRIMTMAGEFDVETNALDPMGVPQTIRPTVYTGEKVAL